MKLLVTGATGFLGWRAGDAARASAATTSSTLVAARRPGARRVRRPARRVAIDAGDPAARELVAGCDAVLHFAGVPDPAGARARPRARGARERRHDAQPARGLRRARRGPRLPVDRARRRSTPPPDAYALSKRLGEEACRLHRARARRSCGCTSVFGPGQVAWEGATGAIAAFAARALDGEPIAIPGDPDRTRDFVYVDDVVGGARAVVADGPLERDRRRSRAASATPLRRAAELVVAAAGSASPIETPGGSCPPARTRATGGRVRRRLPFTARPLDEAITALCRLAPPPSRCSKPRPSLTSSPSGSRAGRGAGLELAPVARHVADDDALAAHDRDGARARRVGASCVWTAEAPVVLAERRLRARRPPRRRGARRASSAAPSSRRRSARPSSRSTCSRP